MTNPKSPHRMLVPARRSNPVEQPFGRRAQPLNVATCVSQAEPAVGTTTHDARIVLVLPVVLPTTHRTDLVATALGQRHIAAARTDVRPSIATAHHVVKPHPRRQLTHTHDDPTTPPGGAHR